VTYVQDAINAVEAELPGLDPDLARLYALLALTTGTRTTPRHVHDAWALHARPDHPCVVPASLLSAAELDKDRPFADGIRRAALRLRARRPNPPAGGPALNLPPLQRGQHLPPDQRAAAAAQLWWHYSQGYNIRQLSDAAGPGYSFGTVARLLATVGTLRDRRSRVPATRQAGPTDTRAHPANVTARPCPTCGADAGQRCRVMAGPKTGLPAVMAHLARVRLVKAPAIVDGTTITDATPFRTDTR
jgi:hypothetical protein